MGRTITLTIVQSNVIAIADLEDEAAPISCAMVWDRLPIEGTLMHGKYSGPELFIDAVDWPDVPPENQIHFARPGDVGYFHIPPGRYATSMAGECEVLFVYEDGAKLEGPEGMPVWVNRIARIRIGSSGDFLEAASKLRGAAPATLRIERGH